MVEVIRIKRHTKPNIIVHKRAVRVELRSKNGEMMMAITYADDDGLHKIEYRGFDDDELIIV